MPRWPWRWPGLLIAILLSQPYLWYYESALLAPAALFLIRARVLSLTHLPGLLLLAAMWLGLGPAILVQFLSGVEVSLRMVFAPILLLTLAVTLRALTLRALRGVPLHSNSPQG